jgi:hypothetical protein
VVRPRQSKPLVARWPVVANDKTLDEARQEFLAAARQEADRFIATATKTAAGQSLTSGQKIKFQVDAVLDGLIFRLEPAASQTAVPAASAKPDQP